MFVRGGVYRVVKEAMGSTLAKFSVSALMFDYILTGPISGEDERFARFRGYRARRFPFVTAWYFFGLSDMPTQFLAGHAVSDGGLINPSAVSWSVREDWTGVRTVSDAPQNPAQIPSLGHPIEADAFFRRIALQS